MKIQLSVKDVMKSSVVVTHTVQIVRMLHQFIFWVIKINMNETLEG